MKHGSVGRVVAPLGIVQILTWGTTYYLLSVMAQSITEGLELPPSLVSAGVSVGVLVSGICAPFVGRWIGRHGGRPVMTSGVLTIAVGLCLLAAAQGPASYLLAWGVIGLGMSASLYDAAFATLGVIFEGRARRAITHLTLIGGFATTVIWPVTGVLVEQIGWRGACLAYAGLHIAITLPLIRLLPETNSASLKATADQAAAGSDTRFDPRILLLMIAGAAMAFVAAVMAIHVITFTRALGYSTTAAIAIAALIGPSQTAGRLFELIVGARLHPIWSAGAACTLSAVGTVGLAIGLPLAGALVLYGAGNGLWSIARGAVPLATFGPEEYPKLIGLIAAPVLIVSAAAPVIGALVIEQYGPLTMVGFLSAAALVAAGALVLLGRLSRPRYSAA